MDQIHFRRHGDVNFHEITQTEFEKFNGKEVKHNGSYIVARGEATNSTHILAVENPTDMLIKEDGETRMVALLKSATITHTHDHEVISTPSTPTYYKQVQEREQDHYSNSVTRKVVD